MASGLTKRMLPVIACFLSVTLFPSTAPASPQTPSSGQFGPPPGMDPTQLADLAALQYGSATIEIHLKEANGAPIEKEAMVTLIRPTGQFFNRANSKGGLVKFDRVPASEFNIQVIAAGYETAEKRVEVLNNTGGVTVDIQLTRLSAEDAAASAGFYALSPKVQKDVGKALQALRANKPNDALHPLEAAQKNAPKSAEIEYFFGLYWSQVKNESEAQSCWTKTLELNPKHLGALLSLSNDFLQEHKPADALPLLNRAVEAEPSSWRAHALLAEALLLQGANKDAIFHAERAIELGHERAAAVRPILERARTGNGQEAQGHGAMRVLEEYVKAHPEDTAAARDLEKMKTDHVGEASTDPAVAAQELAALKDATALPVPSKWLPPDVDDKIPPVEPGAACVVDDVLKKAGARLTELVTDVDRFTATESLVHESIDKFGLPSPPEKRKFDYVVSIQEVQHGYLNVEEYRNSGTASSSDFPDGVATNGLPALVLIFHPYNVVNFEMNCEGLARLSSGLAWQVHFKQRPEKPNTVRRYRIGADGPSYPVALKGRAWIAADTYQIVRLESDLVAPIPQIRLVADHTSVEYGPVQFHGGNVNMWLPQSAEIYYDWRGRRIHRRHSFSNYLLFGVEDKQKISVPKVDDTADSASGNPKQKP